MHLWLLFPILIPLLTALATLLIPQRYGGHCWVSLGGAGALLGAALGLLLQVHHHGIQTTQVGGWPAPYGITLVADLLSATMVVLAGVIGLAVALYSLASLDPAHEAAGYHSLYHFLLVGVCGAFLAGDLFNLYVWFEVMLMASFVLLALGGKQGQMEGAIKYVTLNLLSSASFLSALGILYGLVGTLNMADLARKFSDPALLPSSATIIALAMMFLVAFGIKAAAFPFFFWLPASYPTPPVAVTAAFSGLLTKVGVYALIRLFTLIFVQNPAYTHTLILIMAGLTMVTGVLGAVAQYELRRLLSFHIVSQIGYVLMGLGLLTPLALAGAIFFIFHVSVAKSTLFLISGVVERLGGTFELKKLGGLYQTQPLLAALFLTSALSLAGLPPLSGFFAKLSLVQAGLAVGQYAMVAVALGVSMLTLFSMLKIWDEAFWKPPPSPTASREDASAGLRVWLTPIGLLAGVTVLMGLGSGPLFALALRAGEQLMDPSVYIRSVLGG